MRLLGCNILITRPAVYQDALRQLLQQQGAIVSALPTIEFKVSPYCQEIMKRVRQLDQYWGVVFVSQAAVKYAFELISPHWPQLPLLEWFAIGATTALRLEEQGVLHVQKPMHPPYHSEALLAYLKKKGIRDKKIMLFSGQRTRAVLLKGLRKAQAEVHCLEVYQRVLPVQSRQLVEKRLSSSMPECIITNSYDALLNLWVLISASLQSSVRKVTLIVVGRKAFLWAQAQGFERVVESPGAEDSAILKTLLALEL